MKAGNKQQEAFSELMLNKNPELEAVKADFDQISKKVMIVKEKFEFLSQEQVTPYLAELTEKTLDSISRLQSLVEMNY